MSPALCLIAMLTLLPAAPLPHPAHASAPLWQVAQEQHQGQRIWDALQMQALVPTLQQEARSGAAQLVEEGLMSAGSPGWPEIVSRIHDPARLGPMLRHALGRAAEQADPALLDRALAFYESGPGLRLAALEHSARAAMLDPEIEEAARLAFQSADAAQGSRARLIRRLIDEADLISPNVATGMNTSIAFSQGYAEAGGFDMVPTPDELVADAWAQEDEIAIEAETWMQAFLMLAYSPLSDAEIESYIDFATAPEGLLLADLLFNGFDEVFVQTAREMGRAAAMRDEGHEL
ncbi:DUF2059 domain-containing protein [Paracoccus bogoriensis]|uniref:DUF2059 domain-containing protein n=1 Tax=Paracoccus bogoriensis TaxID=242065 RepID=UPI001CA59AAB|nr:DUF2059 domain-containing protein [Paracoccus bogoriensis]MBW7056451.1 DUF2059 domain-containing protein [Paracoccus bogoriensis]